MNFNKYIGNLMSSELRECPFLAWQCSRCLATNFPHDLTVNPVAKLNPFVLLSRCTSCLCSNAETGISDEGYDVAALRPFL